MSITIFNRLIVSPGKQHRLITNFIIDELGLDPHDICKVGDQLRIEFLIQGRCAMQELSELSNIFPSYNFDLIWFDEKCTFAKSVRYLNQSFHPSAYIGWGIRDYLINDITNYHEISHLDIDWSNLEYDLLLASQQGGFLENTKIIPELLPQDALEILISQHFLPSSSSAQALVLFILNEGGTIQDIPANYLIPDIYLAGFYLQKIPFDLLPDSVKTDTFIEDVCQIHGREIFNKIDFKLLTEDICLAALTADSNAISLKEIPLSLRTLIICEFALQLDIHQFRYIPKKLLSQDFCNQYPAALQFIPGDFKTLELCITAIHLNESLLEFVPKHFISKSLVNKLMKESLTSKPFLKFVPNEFITERMIKTFIKKNPHEFKHIPDEFKTFDICKRFIIRLVENLRLAPVELIDDLLKHRTIRKLYLQHPQTLTLLPKSIVTKELVFDGFKASGIQLDEIPNHLITHDLIILALRRLKQFQVKSGASPISYQSIALQSAKPRIWNFTPDKLKDYAFCKIAIINAHPSVEANILVCLLHNTPRELDAFNESIQWLYFYIESKLSTSFRNQYLDRLEFSDYLEKMMDGSDDGEKELNTFITQLLQEIPHTQKQFAAYREIGTAAWSLWLELCANLYPSGLDSIENTEQASQVPQLLQYTKQVKILNLYLRLGEQATISNTPRAEVTSELSQDDV
jgi:hypothetical protein